MKPMKDPFMKLTDIVSLNLVDAVQLKDNYVALPNQQTATSKGLFVKIAATHSGIVNRNNMFYLPDKMKAGANTFVSPFQKPVLLNHNEESSPIGRIVAAEYVDTSHFVKDKFRGKKIKDTIITDQLIDSFCNGSMPYGAQLDFVRTYLKDAILDDPSYQGMGYINITAHITDQEAIQKFLDGRYLTGSVGAGTDRASCSVCKQDWSKDGMCDHRPGRVYDGAKCYMIAGNFEYDEFSMVNKPADRHAKVLELNFNGVRDNVRVEDIEFSGKLYEVRVAFPKEEDVMKLKDSETNTEKKEEVVTPPAPVADNTTQELSFDDFITRVLDESKGDLTDAEDEKLYALMLSEMKDSKLFEDKQIEDAKLSAEKRKGLAKSTFCGPNKSFPVPDCAHVTAARRLVGRYNGPGDKKSIMACVDRKASAMGCGDMMKDATTQQPTETADQFKDAFTKMVAAAKEKHPDLYKKFVGEVEKALCDEVAALETQLGTLRAELKTVTDASATLKTEYEVTTKEAEKLQDEVVKTKAALRASKEKNLALYKSLKTGTLVDTVDSSITDATIDAELETLTKEVDIKKITDKLNDGTSRKPSGTVENPNGVQDNSKVDATTLKGKLEKIQARYLELKFQNSILADQYLASEMAVLKAAGLLPKDSE